METFPVDNEIKKTKSYNNQAFSHHLLTSAMSPTSGTLYLVPIESPGDFTLRTYRYKYTWSLAVPPVPPGGVGAFSFFVGLYRMMRGTGGTADTLILVPDAPQGTSTQASPVNASGTEYQPQAVVSPIVSLAPEGIYFIGMLWVNTSILPGAATWSVYGTVLSSSADFVYYRGSTGNTALPATVASITVANVGQIYAETS